MQEKILYEETHFFFLIIFISLFLKTHAYL